MGKYTATYDASLKVKKTGSHAQGLFRHLARYDDQQAGFQVKLSKEKNQNLDPQRSHLNITLVNDGQGSYRPLKSVDGERPSDEFQGYLDQRLDQVREAGNLVRADSVVMRPLILQIDPKWFAAHNSDWQENGLNEEAKLLLDTQMQWAEDEFGQENIVGFSLHMDEKNPQLHVLFTPVTEDLRLSQKDFFKGPHHFQKQRQDYRTRLQEVGYDVDFSVSKRSKEHLSSQEFQTKQDRLDRELLDVERRRQIVEQREQAQAEHDAQIRIRSGKLDDRESKLNEKATGLDLRAVNLQNDQRAAQRAASLYTGAVGRVQGLLEDLEEVKEQLTEQQQRKVAQAQQQLEQERDRQKKGLQALEERFGPVVTDPMERARLSAGHSLDNSKQDPQHGR